MLGWLDNGGRPKPQETLRCSFVEEVVPPVGLELEILPWIHQPGGEARVLL